MLKTGLKAWSLGLDEVMRQINDSPHESLPTGVTPNHVMFGRKRKAENRDSPNMRGVIVTISEETINHICATKNPDINEPNVGAFELALETDIQEVEIGVEELPVRELPTSVDSSSSQPPAHPEISSSKNKERASEQVEEVDSNSEAGEVVNEGEIDVEEGEEEEQEAKSQEEAEDQEDNHEEAEREENENSYPNAREPLNESTQILEAQVLQHQTARREGMQKKYDASHKVVVFKEGDFATLAIPKENRVPLDNLRMIVKILEIPRYNRHRLQSQYGILKGQFSTSSLNVLDEQLFPEVGPLFQNAPTTNILLSQAAAKASNAERVALSCNCKKNCTKRCVCVKNGKTCTQYCHKSEIDCGNLPETLLELTEAQLIPRVEVGVTATKQVSKRRRASTIASKKPAAKKAASTRYQPSSAAPATTRAKARARIEDSAANHSGEDQLTMS